MRLTARNRLFPLLAALAVAGLVVLAAAAPRAFSDSVKPVLGDWGVDLAARDTSVKPGDDFFRYANGAWLDAYEIPADLPGTGSFISLYLKSEEEVKQIILDSASENPEPGTNAWKIGTLYNEYNDTATIEEKGLAPLDPYVEQIRMAEGLDRIAYLMATFDRVDGGGWGGGAGMSIFSYYVGQDEKEPQRYVAYMNGAGLALPDRDYYLEDNERFLAAREAYLAYLTEMFTLAGEEDAAERAQAILDLETRIAEAHWPAEELRDREKTYNRMTLEEIEALAPDFPWREYLGAAGLSGQDFLVVNAKSTFTDMARIFRETPAETWKDYLVHRLMHVNASLLPKAVDDAQFTFVSTAITGSQQQRDRDKRATQFVNGAMGEAIGQIYVSRHFPPAAKAQVEELVENLRTAMGERIDGLDWMSDETKAQAREKLAKFTVKIGYPDEWRDYSNLEVKDDDLVGNAMRARAWNHDRNLAKLDGPVDPTEWFMPPQTVNAYYNSSMNEIVFPAAILQPPFFDPAADPAVNYGGIGAVIGHEIGHGFDDQGRKSDGDGVLRDWWTEEDAARFQEKADVLVARYDGFVPLEGMTINGQLTLGENIGDLGGLEIAYHAYKLSLDGKEAPVIDGMTGDQRFFLGFAQIWKGKMRDQILANQLSADPHSPVEYRVNGVLPNVDAWYDAFGVTEDNAMYLAPEERVHIW